MPLQKLKILSAQISPRLNSEGLHLPRGHWPYAMKAPDGQCRHKGGSMLGSNDAQAIRLVLIGRQLRQKLIIRSEEHTSELQSLMRTSYAVFCLKKKNHTKPQLTRIHKSKI